MKVVSKIGFGFLGLILIIIFLGGFAWFALMGTNEGIKNVSVSNLPLLIDTEAAAIIVADVRTEQMLYLKDRQDKSVVQISTKVEELITRVNEAIAGNDDDGRNSEVTLELNAMNTKIISQLTEFQGKFDELKNSVILLQEKQDAMMASATSFASRMKLFYESSEGEQDKTLKLISVINGLKSKIDSFKILGYIIKSGSSDIAKDLITFKNMQKEILAPLDTIAEQLPKKERYKKMMVGKYMEAFYNNILGLTPGSGVEFTKEKKIKKGRKLLPKANAGLDSIVNDFLAVQYKMLDDNKSVAGKLKEMSTLAEEAGTSNLKYLISKNPEFMSVASNKLEKCIALLKSFNNVISDNKKKMMVLGIQKLAIDYKTQFSEWQDLANDITTVLEPNATNILNNTSASFSEIVKVVENHTVGGINGMVADGENRADFGLVISGVSAIVGLILGVYITLLVRRGIMKVLEVQHKLVDSGDLDIVLDEKLLSKNDEIGDLIRVAGSVLGDYKRVNETAQKLAAGDWNAEIRIKSKKDEMNINLSEMVEKMNAALGHVADNVVLVAQGAEQVSEASRSLSDGATTQAAALEEITSSMSQLGSQTTHNAQNAEQANNYSVEANTSAMNGKKQMSELAEAMQTINKSASETQKVVKTIDDIAFQTNLLALNAAVEAARAGVHGKGFAVVAEEVRNLAARSAKAAGETTELIDNVAREISHGNKVASITAEVLDDIALGINKTTELVAEIAVSSGEQASGVEQINQGLKQIDSVTMNNTANAEETASTAIEMKTQADELNDLINHFVLKDIVVDEEEELFLEHESNSLLLDNNLG